MKLDPKDLFSPHINREKKEREGFSSFPFLGNFLWERELGSNFYL